MCSLEINASESGEDYYWAWAASVAGLVLHILAVVHAVLWGLPSLFVGSLVCCDNMKVPVQVLNLWYAVLCMCPYSSFAYCKFGI